MAKILVFSRNTPWGVFYKGNGELEYKNVMRFETDALKNEFIFNQLLTPAQQATVITADNWTSLFTNQKSKAFTHLDDKKASFQARPRDFSMTALELKNADFCAIQQEGFIYFYALKLVEIVAGTYNFSAEIDVFFTFKIGFRDNTQNFIDRAHVDRIKQHYNPKLGFNYKPPRDLPFFYNVEEDIQAEKKILKSIPLPWNADITSPIRVKWQVFVINRKFTPPDGSQKVGEPLTNFGHSKLPFNIFIIPIGPFYNWYNEDGQYVRVKIFNYNTGQYEFTNPHAYNDLQGNPDLLQCYILDDCPFTNDIFLDFEILPSGEIITLIKFPFDPTLPNPYLTTPIIAYEVRENMFYRNGMVVALRDLGSGSIDPFGVIRSNGLEKIDVEINFTKYFNDPFIPFLREPIKSNNPTINYYKDPRIWEQVDYFFTDYMNSSSPTSAKNLRLLPPDGTRENFYINAYKLIALNPENPKELAWVDFYENTGAEVVNNYQLFERTISTTLPLNTDKQQEYLRGNINQINTQRQIAEQKKVWELTKTATNTAADAISAGSGFSILEPFAQAGLIAQTANRAFQGVGEALITHNHTKKRINSRIADAFNQPNPNRTFGENWLLGGSTPWYLNQIRFYENTPTLDNINALNNFFNVYGWLIRDYSNLNEFLSNRFYFNYLEAQETFATIKLVPKLSSPLKQIISNAIANGLTFWHYRGEETFEGVGVYGFVNWETKSLLPQNKKKNND